MALRISTRISIRWGDDEPAEPTTTIVMSVDDHFMDLRVNKLDGSLDWAFAGTREVVSPEPLHCRWHHAIDSRNTFDSDEGYFQPLPNGDDLETGCMPCPDRANAVTPYQEVWHSIPPSPGFEWGWVLQRQSPAGGPNRHSTTTFLGRIGQLFLAMAQQSGDAGLFAVQREGLEPSDADADAPRPNTSRWVVQYRFGDTADLPSLAGAGLLAFPDEKSWKTGDQVHVQGQLYTVRAHASLV